MKKSTRKVTLDAHDKFTVFVRENIKSDIVEKLARKFGVTLKMNNVGFLIIKGDKIGSAKLQESFKRLKSLRRPIEASDLQTILDGKQVEIDESVEILKDESSQWSNITFKDSTGKLTIIKPKTERQKQLINNIIEKKVIFANGSSGTGKTMIGVCVALKMLESKMISKIWISRPALASESFGFLPGPILDKMLPFFLPVYDMIDNIIGREKRTKYMSDGKIEILPIAFARGMNIGVMRPEILIIDESENLTLKQMYLMLSRIGSNINSKIIFCGDSYQSDLGYKDENSLKKAEQILSGSKNVAFTTFTKEDVVRSVEVQEIVERFEQYEYEQSQIKKRK